MSLQGIYELRQQPVLHHAATAACMVAAEDILNEAGNTPNHANRVLWANKPPDVNATQMMNPIAMNTTVQTKWSDRANQNIEEWLRYDDGDIQFIVNSNVDRFATG